MCSAARSERTPPRASPRFRLRLGPALLIAGACGATLAVQWPVLTARALAFDDQQYVLDNYLVRHPSWRSVTQFFSEVLKPSTVQGYYQPLAMTSLMLDYWAAGDVANLRPFHRTSLALHVLNTALVVVILYALFGSPWPAALVGLVFGVHPLTVEPIAWLGERKTVLATFFALWCVLLYVLYARRGRLGLLAGSLGMYVLALLSKPTSTPLPVLLLLLDYWPLRRLGARAVREKVPFAVVGTVSALITVISQAQAGAVALPQEYTPWRIPLTLCHNAVFYLYKWVWPTGLAPHYPFPKSFDLSDGMLRAGLIGTVVLLTLLVLSLRWTRSLVTGWLFFFVALLPTTGVIGFTIVIASDKYAYLPVFGFLLVLAHGLRVLWNGERVAAGMAVRRVGVAAVVLVLAALAAGQTRRQLGYWQSTERLYAHMLTIAPDAEAVHADLGLELSRQGRGDEAIEHYRQALAANPHSIEVLSNLGMEYARQGNRAAAIEQFQAALRVSPQAFLPHFNLAVQLAELGRHDEAIEHYDAALKANPSAYWAHFDLAMELQDLNRLDEAIRHFQAALEINPGAPQVHNNLSALLLRQGRPLEAEQHLRAAVRLDPLTPIGYLNLGRVLELQGKWDEALRTYEAGLRAVPGESSLHAAYEAAMRRAGEKP